MNKKNSQLLLCFVLINCCSYSVLVSNEGPERNGSYYSKIMNEVSSLQKYLYRQVSFVFDVDIGVNRTVAKFKADIRKKYPEENHDDVQVRQGKDLCQSEIDFVNNRMPKISTALKENFDVEVPFKIAFCSSGGGNRAMLTTLGFYLGMQDIGLLDATLYTAGVSGSTWMIVPWSYLHATQNMSLTQFKNQLMPRLNRSMATINGTSTFPMIKASQKDIMINNIAKRFAYNQFVSSIDAYSGFVGDYTLQPVGENRLNVTWSSIADTIKEGDMPLPMGAAVSYKTRESVQERAEYYWFEMGPFEVGSDQLESYVATKAFGSKFNNGKPVYGYPGNAPEYPISYYEGIFGSVFTFSMHEIIDRVTDRPTFTLFGKKIVLPIDLWIRSNFFESVRNTRFAPATFHNFTRGLSDSPISTEKRIRLYDGAMNFNLPLPLLMRPARQVDVIVVSDADVDLLTLKLARIHSLRNGTKFPHLGKYTDEILASKPMTVLNDPRSLDYDKNVLTILYCPFVKNDKFSEVFDPAICMDTDFCNTFNFKYSKEQAEQVVDLTRYNINSVKDEIKQVLQALQTYEIAEDVVAKETAEKVAAEELAINLAMDAADKQTALAGEVVL